MISTASPPPLRIPPNRQDTPPAEPAKKFKSLRLALYGSNPGYPTGTGSSVNLRVGLAGTKDKRRQRTAQQVSSTRGRSARPMKISGGNVRRPGGGAADQTQGLGERDAVGVQVCGRGRLRDQRADRVVHDQVGVDLLVDQVGQPGPEDLPGAAEMSLELVVPGFLFPSFVIRRR